MPVTAQTIFNANRLDPLYDADDALLLPFNFNPGVSLTRGTVVGQVTAAVNEVQTLTVTATGGTYTLSYTNPVTGVTTTSAATAFNASTATQQTNINAIVGSGAITVAGAGPYTYTWNGTAVAGQNQPLLVVNTASLTGGSATMVETTQGAIAGVMKAYASGNSDGSEVPKGILQYDIVTDSAGRVYLGTSAANQYGDVRLDAPVYFAGTFDCSLLTGLDANALTAAKWRLISGSVATGIVRLG